MSLKFFHIVFVTLSIFLSLGFGIWCLTLPEARTTSGYTVSGVVSIAAAVGLGFYGVKFLKKFKQFGWM